MHHGWLRLKLSKFQPLTSRSLSLGVLLAIGLFPTAPDADTAAPPIPQLTLREVFEEDIVGLSKEPTEIHTRARDSARKYVQWKRNQLSQKDSQDWNKACTEHPEQDDFCPIVLGLLPETKEEDEDEIREEVVVDVAAQLSARDTQKAIERADFPALKRVKAQRIYRAYRPLKDPAQFKSLIARALGEPDRSNCDQPAIATATAQKAETFFPNAELRKQVLGLYEKVIECPRDEIVERARFRYGLLKYEDGDLKAADAQMARLYRDSSDNYGPRALYWRAQVAQKQGNRLLVDSLAQRLLKEYPLSYHSIVLNRAKVARLARVLGVGEPAVLLRSHESPKVNSWLRAIEALHEIGADDHARRLLIRIVDPLSRVETGVRLYVGVLSNRIGDPISQFRLLSSIFKDDPKLISQNTLKLFYPLKNAEALKKYGVDTDPLFVASLIRQESGFNPWAKSPVGAVGLMQLMPATARSMERVRAQALWNPNTNIRLGTRFIAKLVNRYNRDAELALAAYNAGTERVDEWVKRYPTQDRMLFLDLIPYKETRDYVVLISRNYFWYSNLYGDLMGVPPRSGRPGIGTARAIAATASTPDAKKKLIFTLFQ